jgi:hypothetical protein
MRDRQRQKVYDWENKSSWSGKCKDELNEQQCLFIINSLNKIYKGMRVYTTFVNGERRNATCGNRITSHEIKLPRQWALCWSVVLHEYAHAISDDRKYKERTNRAIEPHGKEFVTAFCVLLHKFHPEHPSYKELSQSLRDANVDFEHMESSKFHKQIGRKTIKLTKAKEDKDYDFNTSLLKLTSEGKRRLSAGDGFYKPKTKMNRVLCVLDYSIIFIYKDKPITYKKLEASFNRLPYFSDHYNKLIHKVLDEHGKIEPSLVKYMIKQGLIVATSTQNKG